MNTEQIANKLTPDAAERLMMIDALLGNCVKFPQPVPEQPKPEAKKPTWPQLGEVVHVRKDYFGVFIQKDAVFTGVTFVMVESKYQIVGHFVTLNDGCTYMALAEDIQKL